jgi:hypothetical protein
MGRKTWAGLESKSINIDFFQEQLIIHVSYSVS